MNPAFLVHPVLFALFDTVNHSFLLNHLNSMISQAPGFSITSLLSELPFSAYLKNVRFIGDLFYLS
jgi:hypothetical protein